MIFRSAVNRVASAIRLSHTMSTNAWRMRTLLYILACVAVVATFGCSSGPGPAVQGEAAPEFTFKDQSGKEFSLSQLRGKVVLVNFWATFCPPCIDEMPSLQLLQRRMANKP